MRRTEEFGVRVLVGEQRRPAGILVDGGHDLEGGDGVRKGEVVRARRVSTGSVRGQ